MQVRALPCPHPRGIHNLNLMVQQPHGGGANGTFTEYQIDLRGSILGVVQFHHVPLIFNQMEIKGKVHCFFEQSGTFKNEFRKLGYEAEDYDIQNEFGETDHVVDLFKNIDDAYDGEQSLFKDIY